MAVSAVILYLAVCDVRNKAGVCDKSVYYVMRQPFFFLFFALQCKRANQHGFSLGSSNLVQLLHEYLLSSHTNPANLNICTVSTSSDLFASSLGVRLKTYFVCLFLKFELC